METKPAAKLPLSTLKATENYFKKRRVKFTATGSNLAMKAQAFFMSQPSFREEHGIELS